MTPLGDAWLLSWPSKGIEIEFSRWSEERGTLYAEVTVHSTRVEARGLLHRSGRVNLSGPVGRRDVIRALRERGSEEFFGWTQMVEHAVFLGVEAYRAGRPAVDLWEVQPRAIKHLLYPYIAADGLSHLWATGGSGKSTLAMLFTCFIASGTSGLGLRHADGDIVPTLYVDYEDEDYVAAERMRAICRGMHIPGHPPIFHRPMSTGFTEGLADTRRLISDLGIRFGVLDSLSAARAAGMEDSGAAIRILVGLRETGIPWLVIDHTNREDSQRGDAKYASGPMATHNAVRISLYLQQFGEPGDPERPIVVTNRKANHVGEVPKRAFTVAHQTDERTGLLDRVLYRRADVTRIPEALGRLPLRDRIMAELRSQPATGPDQVAEQLDEKPFEVKSKMQQLEQSGKIVRRPDGMWVIAAVSGMQP